MAGAVRVMAVYTALRLGASGYLLKDAPRRQLVEGVRAAARGETVLAPSVLDRLVSSFVGQVPPSGVTVDLGALSDGETEVLRLVALGLANRETEPRPTGSSSSTTPCQTESTSTSRTSAEKSWTASSCGSTSARASCSAA